MTQRDAIEEQVREIAIDHAVALDVSNATGRADCINAVCVTFAAAVALCVPDLRLTLWPLAVLWVGVWWLVRPALREQLALFLRRIHPDTERSNEHA